MEQAGHKCVGFCEIDKYARQAYKANFDTGGEKEIHDITTVSDTEIRALGAGEPIEVICAGFPCQAFSISGKRAGFNDTRGTLFFEITRFARILRPKYLFLENVKGLLSHDKGRTFETILNALDELGYDAEWQVLNSKDYVPQNRERVFIIGHCRRQRTKEVFPFGEPNNQTLKQIIGGSQRNRVYSPEGLSITLTCQGNNTGLYLFAKNNGKVQFRQIATCIDANYYRGLGCRQQRTGIIDGVRIRRLTPLECFRLQGFPDRQYYNAKNAGLSDTQLYKQIGNSVTVPVIYEIAKRL